MMLKKIALATLFLCSSIVLAEGVDIIVYSYNRPAQLEGLLRGIKKHISGISSLTVLYRADTDYVQGYQLVEKEYPTFSFVKQGSEPYKDFKPLLMKHGFGGKSPYIMFAVDDDIIKGPVDLEFCTEMMEKTGAYHFSLRLGENINCIYDIKGNIQFSNPLPNTTKQETENVVSWAIGDSTGGVDWQYIHSNDMHVYRKKDIQSFFERSAIQDTTYEGPWAGSKEAHANKQKRGLAFKESKIFNIPCNRVLASSGCPEMGISTKLILDKFMQGKKINVEKWEGFKNRSTHMYVGLEFI